MDVYDIHKRLQIYIDEDLDAALAVRARRLGTSKAALIRQYVSERIGEREYSVDPIGRLIGFVAGTPNDSVSVDDVLYGERQ
ncbi:MAG: CopG family transcriptional regulator [Jiangellaceae bacterium]